MKHHNEKKRKKIFTKARLLRAGKGSISILLCLLITPFLSIALGLVEYSRYQEALEITDEIYELTGISVLADYDSYIHQRFGFLATDQTAGFGGAESLLQQNAKMMGRQIDVNDPSVSGKFPLNNDVLKKQMMDVSELTATTAVIGEDFSLNDLLDKISNLSGFQNMMDSVKGLSKLTRALKKAVSALKKLRDSVSKLSSLAQSAINGANTLAEKLADFFKNLSEKQIMLPENATDEQINTAIESLCKDYLNDLKGIYTLVSDLITVLQSIKTEAESIIPNVNDFIDAVNEAKDAAGSISGAGKDEPGGAASEETTSVLQDVLDALSELVEGTLSDLKDGTTGAISEAINTIINASLEEIGLDKEKISRYEAVIAGDYFKMPLSDLAKADLIDLLKTVQKLYNENKDAGDFKTALINYFKELLVPDLRIGDTSVAALSDIIKQAYDDASEKIKASLAEGLIKFINKLIEIVKGLFDLEVFSNPDLNAFVNSKAVAGSPYQDFLEAVGRMLSAINSFMHGGILSKLDILGTLDKLHELFESIVAVFKAIGDIVKEMFASISELGSGTKAVYEKFLISAYLRHNLPSRCDAATKKYGQSDGTATSKVPLNGKGLTGLPYDDIARPDSYEGQIFNLNSDDTNKTRFENMHDMIAMLEQGYGNDKMFKGAELEYIVAGTNSETANQIVVFFDIYFLRLLLDLPSIFLDSEVTGIAAAASVASWVVYILYILAEPFCDTLILVNGGEIPLLRSKCWLTPSGIVNFGKSILEVTVNNEKLRNELNESLFDDVPKKDGGEGADGTEGATNGLGNMNYQTHVLVVLMLMTEANDQLNRFQSLIEMECKVKYGDDFTLTRAYTAAEISSEVTFRPFFDLGIASGGESLLPTNHITRTVSY